MVTDLDKVDARGFVNFCGANFTVFDHRFIRSILDRGLKKNADVWDRNRIRAFNPCHFYTLPTDSKPASSWHASKRAGIDEETAHTAVEDAKKMIRLTRRHFGIGDSGKSVARERVSDARNQANEIANQMYGNIESARKRAREFLSAAQQAKEAFGKMRDS
jgi:hypothetical protein